MKNEDSSAFINDMQELQGDKEDTKERSRGKRRTAREIAQMFEQLKQRHLAKKKQWQSEKQELMKQASVADESKLLLMELKRLLEELKNQLGTEEKKRMKVEDEFDKAKGDWRIEKERLLKIIANLESKRLGGAGYDKNLTEELDVVKTKLLAREKDLAIFHKSNTDFQKTTQEIQKRYEIEKQNIIRNHEGEKRNWEKARQVMLEKIESLQDELRNSQIDPFPLHGSHVGSPFDDVISALTSSPDMDDYYSTESKTPAATARISETCTNAAETTEPTYMHFQRTVDEALQQIEKITQDLNQVKTNNSDLVYTSTGSQNDKFLPHTSSLTIADRSRSLQKDMGNKIKVEDKQDLLASSAVTHSDKSKSLLSNTDLRKIKTDRQTLADITDYTNEKKPTSNFLHECGKFSASPVISLSPSESCSIPTFTESSTESPQIPTILKSEESVKSSTSSQRNETPEQPSFTKIDKKYIKPSAHNSHTKRNSADETATKKLPNLHQQLLFGNASKPRATPKDDITADQTASPKESKQSKHFTYFTSGNNESAKQQRNAKNQTINNGERNRKSVQPESSETSNLKKQSLIKKPSTDKAANFVQESTSLKSTKPNSMFDKMNFESVPAPPVRPKPSITIEKDTRGNVLRVISDPRYSRQQSPMRTGHFEEGDGRRRRSNEATHNTRALIFNKTNATMNSSNDTKELSYHKQVKQQDKEGFGSRGKSWIKKRLSFLDTPQKDDETFSPKPVKKGDRVNSKTRSSSARRGESRKKVEHSTSEDSDAMTENTRRKLGKKDSTEKRGKAKRYTRSKTESAVDVRNLLAKFKASQFSSKKPSIVKEFEKKLLENEVKTLEEDKAKRNQSSAKKKESLRITQIVREKQLEDDDGYRGEDELDLHTLRRRAKSKTLPAALGSGLVRSSSIRSLQEQLFASRSSPKRSFHRSMINLSLFDDKYFESLPEKSDSSEKMSVESQSPTKQEYSPNSSNKKTKEIKSPISCNITHSSDVHVQQSDKLAKDHQTKEASPSYLSLPDSKPGGKFGKKRLSWAANLQQSFEDGHEEEPPPSPSYVGASDRTTTTAVSGILLKPKSEHGASPSPSIVIVSNKSKSNSTCSAVSKNKGRLSQDMKKKADNLEKVLKKGPTTSKARRYKRSDTQPIAWSPTTEESDSDCKPSQGMVRSHSMSNEVFTKEFHNDLTPGLTSRFKKPKNANRRLPSRWKKKNS